MMMNESLRQVVHLIFGLGIAGFVLLFDRDIVLSILVLTLFVGFILSDAVARGYIIPVVSPIISGLERRDVAPGKGALFFALGALFCIVFFAKEVAFAGIVVLSLLDSVTTLVGVRFGRTRIYNHKSLEGTLAGFAVTAAVLSLFILPGIAIVTAVASAIAELVSPVDDNLIIPVVACLSITLLL
jgi:dolichol kinase